MVAHTLGNPFDLGGRRRLRQEARPLAGRGLLRRRRLDLRGQARRHVRRPGDGQLLPGPPHHDGRGRLRADRPARGSRRWSSRSATGAATAGAPRAPTTPAASGSTGSSATCPHGYDHKYIYSHIGYNLKVTDMQAAVGVAQLDKLDGFIAARGRNFRRLHEGLSRPRRSSSSCPRRRPGSDPSWFGFPLVVRAEAPFSRGRAGEPPERAEDRHPAGLRRQPPPPARLRGRRAPPGRRPGQHRLRHEPGLLGRRLPGPRATSTSTSSPPHSARRA